jgi:hypothetical protein
MRSSLIAIIAATLVPLLHAEEPSPRSSPAHEAKTVTRDFFANDLHFISSNTDGEIHFTADQTDFDYRPFAQSSHHAATQAETLAAAATLVSQLREASKVSLTLEPIPSTNRFKVLRMTFEFAPKK